MSAYRRNKLTRKQTSLDFSGDQILTEQAHKEMCDIHNIVKRYQATGTYGHINNTQGIYADVPPYEDFSEAMRIVAEAQSMFNDLPAELRADMDNNPAVFLEFINNPENKHRIDEYGLDSSHLQIQTDIEDFTLEPPQPPLDPPLSTDESGE